MLSVDRPGRGNFLEVTVLVYARVVPQVRRASGPRMAFLHYNTKPVAAFRPGIFVNSVAERRVNPPTYATAAAAGLVSVHTGH